MADCQSPRTGASLSSVNLFEFDSVSIAYDGRPVLDDFSLAIAEGDKVVFRGPSGSGKSTLLRLLLGIAQPDSGGIRFWGEPLSPPRAWALRREVAYVNQSPGFDTGKVDRFFTDFFHLKAAPALPERRVLEAELARLDLERVVLDQQVGELSGGERQRIALAAAVLLERSIFLLDEPTAALDGNSKQRVAGRFLDAGPEWTVIAATHDDAWFEGRDHITLIDLKSP